MQVKSVGRVPRRKRKMSVVYFRDVLGSIHHYVLTAGDIAGQIVIHIQDAILVIFFWVIA
jgi:hypothetical protein